MELVNFTPALAEAPEKEMDALRERVVGSPFDFIDFWAVDFEHREGKPFELHSSYFKASAPSTKLAKASQATPSLRYCRKFLASRTESSETGCTA